VRARVWEAPANDLYKFFHTKAASAFEVSSRSGQVTRTNLITNLSADQFQVRSKVVRAQGQIPDFPGFPRISGGGIPGFPQIFWRKSWIFPQNNGENLVVLRSAQVEVHLIDTSLSLSLSLSLS